MPCLLFWETGSKDVYFLVCILKSLLTPSFPGFLPQFGIMTHIVTCSSILYIMFLYSAGDGTQDAMHVRRVLCLELECQVFYVHWENVCVHRCSLEIIYGVLIESSSLSLLHKFPRDCVVSSGACVPFTPAWSLYFSLICSDDDRWFFFQMILLQVRKSRSH